VGGWAGNPFKSGHSSPLYRAFKAGLFIPLGSSVCNHNRSDNDEERLMPMPICQSTKKSIPFLGTWLKLAAHSHALFPLFKYPCRGGTTFPVRSLLKIILNSNQIGLLYDRNIKKLVKIN